MSKIQSFLSLTLFLFFIFQLINFTNGQSVTLLKLILSGQDKNITIPWEKGMTAWTAMQLAQYTIPNITFVAKDYSFGHLIVEIDNLPNDSQTGLYWLLFYNGAPSTVGVDFLYLKESDVFSWDYQLVKSNLKYQQQIQQQLEQLNKN
eukprot:TRINITY_DN290_c2_g1_i1.p1 TRINITY_DN290_c2_g1~~TRINITY_DN290_c2_g1_i1.p1  ORF type:complete len:148 (-),score=52.86 TRINITY_DN290_c2_g1_i1:63-506(-)